MKRTIILKNYLDIISFHLILQAFSEIRDGTRQKVSSVSSKVNALNILKNLVT